MAPQTLDASTPLFTGRVRSASVAIWLRSVRVQLGHVCQGPQRPTDMTGIPCRKLPRNINERGRRSSDLAAVSCPSLLAYIGAVRSCTPRCSDTDALLRCSGHAYKTPAFLLWKHCLGEPLAGIMPVMNAQRKQKNCIMYLFRV